jgi:hypothetical protein
MSNKISIKIMGGLGNQLFQIFFVLAYAKKYNLQYYFPNTGNKIGKRKTYWNTCFRSLRKFVMPSTLLKKYSIVYEEAFEFQEYPFHHSVMFHGYFQSFLYFENYKKEILKELQWTRISQQIDSPETNSVSLHFRIGDYQHVQHYHPILPLDYYQKALTDLMSVRTDWIIYYFFEKQDSSQVTKNIDHLQQEFSTLQFIAVTEFVDDYKELIFMSKCTHHIIANSTFSWWGAYLNDTAETITYYPSVWFGPTVKHDTKDLFPPHWKKIL